MQRASGLRKSPVQRQGSERTVATLFKRTTAKPSSRVRVACARAHVQRRKWLRKKRRGEGNRPAARANKRNAALGFAGCFWRSLSSRRGCGTAFGLNAGGRFSSGTRNRWVSPHSAAAGR